MTQRPRGLVVWSGLLALCLVACGSTSAAGPGGSGGAVATAGAAGAAAYGGGGATGGSSSGGSPSSTGGASGTGGAVPTAPPNPDLVAPTAVAELCASLPYDRGDLMARCYGGEAEDWAGSWDQFCGAISASEADGRLVLDQDRVDACYASLAAGVCAVGLACTDLMLGTVAVGEACSRLSIADECSPQAYCRQAGDCGVCEPRGTVGEQCAGQFVDLLCGAGLVCDGSVCTPIAHEGDPCSGPIGACATGLHCDADGDDEGVCRPVEPLSVPLKKVGEACTFGLDECFGYCSLEGVCEAFAHEGDPCGTLADETGELSESISCGVGFYCAVVSVDPTEWACTRQVPVEQSCE